MFDKFCFDTLEKTSAKTKVNMKFNFFPEVIQALDKQTFQTKYSLFLFKNSQQTKHWEVFYLILFFLFWITFIYQSIINYLI